jgi:DNA-binding CsgD family transcriptional regulator
MQLQVFEAALSGSELEFRRCAERWLAAGISFDGLLWGHGGHRQRGAAPDQASLQGRPQSMLERYAAISRIDTLCKALASRPGLVQNVVLQAHYAALPCVGGALYWSTHKVGFLLAYREPAGANAAPGWIKLLREPGRQLFDVDEHAHAQMAMPLILQAERLQLDKIASRCLHISVAEKQNGTGLTPKEAQVASAYGEGKSVKQIARAHNVATSTVQSQLRHIFRKLDVHSKLQLRDKMPPGAGGP